MKKIGPATTAGRVLSGLAAAAVACLPLPGAAMAGPARAAADRASVAATAASDRGYGHLDLATGAARSVRVAGWIIDPATPASVDVYVWIDGGGAGSGYASLYRPDVGDAYPGYGPYHGFDVTVPAAPGFHTVCMYLSEFGPAGGWSPIDCRSVAVS